MLKNVTSKNQGFSIVEVLVGLTLASLILSLVLENLHNISISTAKMIAGIEQQDNAMTALILLAHQTESARLSECAPDSGRRAYQILSPTQLQLYQLSDTFYLDHYPAPGIFNLPKEFRETPNLPMVIDDCHHAVTGSWQNVRLTDFQLPVSISLLHKRVYSFADHTLYLKQDNGKRNKVILPLETLIFENKGITIDGKYHGAF